MLLTLSEAAGLLERKRGLRVHRTTIKKWGNEKRFQLHYANGWKVDETEFIAWAARSGRLKPIPATPVLSRSRECRPATQ